LEENNLQMPRLKESVVKYPKILIFLVSFMIFVSIMGPVTIGVFEPTSDIYRDDISEELIEEDPILNDYDREPMPEALDALESDENVTVTEEEDSLDRISFDPVDEDPVVGMVFGAGGEVDPRAYAPAARTIAEEGYFVVLFYPGVGMPDGGPFGDVIDYYPEIEIWSVGGHSNGGMNACEYFDDEEPDGLHLWAAYPSPGFIGIGETDLSDKEGEFMSIYGTNDGVTTVDDIEDSEQRLPDDTDFVEIEGGNHAQFGWYGDQSGDGEADITREEQQNITIENTLSHLESLWGYHLDIGIEGSGTTYPGSGEHHFGEGEEVSVTAEPEDGWEFSHWSGDVNSNDEQITLLMDDDKSITANFIEEETNLMEIDLDSSDDGWNFISFNLDIDDTCVESILENEDFGISGSYDKLMYYDSEKDEWQSYIPTRDDLFNNLDNWDNTMGVWIQMNIDDTLTIEGTEPTTTEITLHPGWNMVGLPSENHGNHGLPSSVSIVGYLETDGDERLSYDYDPDNFEFEPGQGYYIYNDAVDYVTWTVGY